MENHVITPLNSLAEVLSWTASSSGPAYPGHAHAGQVTSEHIPFDRAASAILTPPGLAPAGRRAEKYLDGREWQASGTSWDWLVANPLRNSNI